MVWRGESKISREAKKGCRLPHPEFSLPPPCVYLFHMGKTEATSQALKKGITPALAPGQETNGSPFRCCPCGPPLQAQWGGCVNCKSLGPATPSAWRRGGVWPPPLPGGLPRLLSSWLKSSFCGSASVPGETIAGLVVVC